MQQQARSPFSSITPLLVVCIPAMVLIGCASAGSAYEEEKVTICHKEEKTLVIPHSALSAHLAHGDTRGPCE